MTYNRNKALNQYVQSGTKSDSMSAALSAGISTDINRF